jgi:solute carrier family 25 2-oxodicarboxylate transporter 21
MSTATGATAEKKPLQSLPFHYQFVAGGVAGTSEILIMYPLDVVKTRFQLQSGATKEYSSVLDCFRKMIAQEGFGRLYRGIVPPIMMEVRAV